MDFNRARERAVIQITPQIRVVVVVEPADFRIGLELCCKLDAFGHDECFSWQVFPLAFGRQAFFVVEVAAFGVDREGVADRGRGLDLVAENAPVATPAKILQARRKGTLCLTGYPLRRFQ